MRNHYESVGGSGRPYGHRFFAGGEFARRRRQYIGADLIPEARQKMEDTEMLTETLRCRWNGWGVKARLSGMESMTADFSRRWGMATQSGCSRSPQLPRVLVDIEEVTTERVGASVPHGAARNDDAVRWP